MRTAADRAHRRFPQLAALRPDDLGIDTQMDIQPRRLVEKSRPPPFYSFRKVLCLKEMGQIYSGYSREKKKFEKFLTFPSINSKLPSILNY